MHACRVRDGQFALVRWYEEEAITAKRGAGSALDVLALHGYPKLKWATTGGGQPEMAVIKLSSIARREYIVQDFASLKAGEEPKHFYVSKSKRDRPPKDDTASVAQLGP